MPVDYLFTWLLIFLRAVGVVLLMPQMAGHAPPITVRLGLAACVATLLVGLVPSAHLGPHWWDLASAAAGDVVLGLALGFVAQLAFSAVELAGRIMSPEVGLSAAHGMSAPDLASEPLAAFLGAFAVVLFFLFGGQFAVLSAFARSFDFAPPGHAAFAAGTSDFIVRATGHVIELGLRLAAPFIALNFLVTLAFSVLGRAVPRMFVFVLSAPVRGMAGLALLSGAGGLIARYLFSEFSSLPRQMLQLVAH